MKAIKDIFNNVLFRIPDYQRGYSWERTHLNDFWQDLMNLQADKIHYTGMISVEEVDRNEYSTWTEDQWLINGKSDIPYFVVDGQQRLTTIIILIWIIANRMQPGTQLGYLTKEQLIEKYIFTENKQANEKSFIFGYHKDNPSYEFLKQEVFEQTDEQQAEALEETAYTNNLVNAKRFFVEKTKKFSQNDLGILLDKITKQIRFDFKILEKELDIFIVFETMNNRGKPLSNLEKLKNRLIYLSTLLKDETPDRKWHLRNEINSHWKIIYKYLGLNKDRRLEDDLFLQNHWIMFKRYDRREPEFYATDIFYRYFTPQKVIDGDEGYDTVLDYIESMSASAQQWFVMNNPHHLHATEISKSPMITNWLKKINRLGFKSFAPLIMGALVIDVASEKVVALLRAIESHIFLIFDVSFRRSNTGTYHFNAQASELYSGETSLEMVTKDVYFWIFGSKDSKGYFDVSSFYLSLKDLFVRENTNGYFDWKFLKYFLFEYELSLKRELGFARAWADLTTIQHVYPNKPVLTCWKNQFKQYNAFHRKTISGSLGNFVLANRSFDEQLCFNDKKMYYNDFANAHLINTLDVWDKEHIQNRGLDMLAFMERRWGVNLGSEQEKIKLLFLDFD
jgi:hypothetical protein